MLLNPSVEARERWKTRHLAVKTAGRILRSPHVNSNSMPIKALRTNRNAVKIAGFPVRGNRVAAAATGAIPARDHHLMQSVPSAA